MEPCLTPAVHRRKRGSGSGVRSPGAGAAHHRGGPQQQRPHPRAKTAGPGGHGRGLWQGTPKCGVWGGPEGAEPDLTCSLVFGKPHPEVSPSCTPSITAGSPWETSSGVPQPCSDKGPIPGLSGLYGALLSRPSPPHPRCGMMPTAEPRSWLRQRAGSTSTPSITPWCGECCQDSAPAPGPHPRDPGWPGGAPRLHPAAPHPAGRVTPAWSGS